MPVAIVYIAGPYTNGDTAMNVRSAFLAAEVIRSQGLWPFVPHHSHFWHMMFPHPYEYWMRYDLEFLPVCNALLRLPGDSKGADREVAEAKRLGIPVFSSIEELVEALTGESVVVRTTAEVNAMYSGDHGSGVDDEF